MNELTHDPGEEIWARAELLGEVGPFGPTPVLMEKPDGLQGKVGSGGEFETYS
jgi:hypothetical protein